MVFRDTKNLGGNLLRAVENVFLNFLCMRQNAVFLAFGGLLTLLWFFLSILLSFPSFTFCDKRPRPYNLL